MTLISPARALAAPIPAVPSPAPRRMSLARQVRIQWLRPDGSPGRRETTIPVAAPFETAFNAFARGTLISTPSGPVAVEDLLPGDAILTRDGTALPLQWLGAMTLVPDVPVDDPAQLDLTRVMTDHFGPGKPLTDLLLGPGARLLGRDAAGPALIPASACHDGMTAFAVRPRHPVQLHHLMLPRHAVIMAGDVPVETWHPGPGLGERMGGPALTFLMSLFPHLNDLADFGAPCLRRLPLWHGQDNAAA